jgi:hypothetical protein
LPGFYGTFIQKKNDTDAQNPNTVDLDQLAAHQQ